MDGRGWRKFAPRADGEGVFAAQVDHPFTVDTSWGVLKGAAGDFVVKPFVARDNPYPADVWVVKQKLFASTYETTR